MTRLTLRVISLCLIAASAWAFGLVNNSGTTSEDSLSLVCYALDSLGNPDAADSFFVRVHGPGGDSVFAEAITVASTRLDSSVVAGVRAYVYRAAVADIDGSGGPGLYDLSIVARSSALDLDTPARTAFQVVGWELDDIGDSIGLAATAAAAALDSLGQVIDSLYAVLDSLQSLDDWVSAFDPDTDSVMISSEITASVDSSAVARAVWNTPQTNHVLTGTFGDYLDSDISGVGSGGGAYSVTVIAYDSCTGSPIEHAGVAVRDTTESNLIAVGRTDSQGRVPFSLDADSYHVLATAHEVAFGDAAVLTVAGATTDTVNGCRFVPVIPAVPPLCRVYGSIFAAHGQPETGVLITARVPGGVSHLGSTVISPLPVSTHSDSLGYFSLDLVPSALLSASDNRYEITVTRTDGTILRKRVTVPDQSSWSLSW